MSKEIKEIENEDQIEIVAKNDEKLDAFIEDDAAVEVAAPKKKKSNISVPVDKFDWEKLASVLSELAPVIAKFFNDVLVMDEDISLRNNRLALLKKCQNFFLLVGDFSLLK